MSTIKRGLRGEKRVIMRRMLCAMGKRDAGSDAPAVDFFLLDNMNYQYHQSEMAGGIFIPIFKKGKVKNMDKRPTELNDTVKMMNSEDYKERFRAEYCQTVIRYGKLKNMLDRWDNGNLNFTPTCPRSIYNMQIRAMADYIAVLEARAVMEDIDLSD